MSDATARFALPFILPGQAQKELYHNEALARIDAALHAAIESAPLGTPPLTPVDGQCWIVADGANGAWAGKDRQIAIWTNGGWRFIVAQPGMLVWNKTANYWVYFDGVEWSNGIMPVAAISVGGQQVVGSQQPPISSPSGGTTIDSEARIVIGQIIVALMSHGLIG